MAANAVSKTKGGKGSAPSSSLDHTTFFAPAVPLEVKECIDYLNNNELISPDRLSTVVVQILREILKPTLPHGTNTNEDVNILAELQRHLSLTHLDGSQFGVLYTGLYRTLHTALRKKVRASDFASHLSALGMPDIVISPLGKAYTQLVAQATSASSSSPSISAQLIPLTTCRWFPTVTQVKWRVDVTMSSGSLSRVMRPNISMQVCK
jgi:hypothetical protein